jgi:hypothetical protein
VRLNLIPDFPATVWPVVWASLTWIATILVVALLMGFIAHLALKKARPEDLPAVLSGLSSIADRLTWWLHRRRREKRTDFGKSESGGPKDHPAPEVVEPYDVPSVEGEDPQGDER